MYFKSSLWLLLENKSKGAGEAGAEVSDQLRGWSSKPGKQQLPFFFPVDWKTKKPK